jgi:hypothetical protein
VVLANLNNILLCKEDILWLDVAMNDVECMYILHRARHLPSVPPHPSVLCDVISVVTEFMVTLGGVYKVECTFSVWTQFTV